MCDQADADQDFFEVVSLLKTWREIGAKFADTPADHPKYAARRKWLDNAGRAYGAAFDALAERLEATAGELLDLIGYAERGDTER